MSMNISKIPRPKNNCPKSRTGRIQRIERSYPITRDSQTRLEGIGRKRNDYYFFKIYNLQNKKNNIIKLKKYL